MKIIIKIQNIYWKLNIFPAFLWCNQPFSFCKLLILADPRSSGSFCSVSVLLPYALDFFSFFQLGIFGWDGRTTCQQKQFETVKPSPTYSHYVFTIGQLTQLIFSIPASTKLRFYSSNFNAITTVFYTSNYIIYGRYAEIL